MGLANIWAAFLLLACLPSLRPIVALISDKTKKLRKHKGVHSKDSQKLTHTSKPRTAVSDMPLATIDEESAQSSLDNRHNSVLDSSSVVDREVEAPCSEMNAATPWEPELE